MLDFVQGSEIGSQKNFRELAAWNYSTQYKKGSDPNSTHMGESMKVRALKYFE